ncbi:MAG: hypothetical protein ABI779_27390 [Acidobacteriota bacterium]
MRALQQVEASISSRKGGFALFAAFLPSDGLDQWDLVVSAPWARRDDRIALDIIRDELAAAGLDERDAMLLGRIVVVETWHPDVQEINARVDVEHGLVSITNETHFGYVAERGYIMTSQDSWLFLKRVFPQSDFAFYTRDGNLRIRISWHLGDDPSRPFRRSRNIILAITEEALDILFSEDPHRRTDAEQKLAAFVADRKKTFDPSHDAPASATPPREKWPVTPELFRRPAAAVG